MALSRRARWAAAALLLVAGLVAVSVALLSRSSTTRPETEGQRPTWESAPAVAATFTSDSYAPGATARLVLWRSEDGLTVQFFRIGARQAGWNHTTMQGIPVSAVQPLGPVEAHRPVPLPIGNWRSGVYYARLQAGDLAGYAPFVVRPRRLGEHRVLIVEPTFTWQAYNFRDDNGDGRGDTWYDSSDTRTVRLDRPFLSRGIPAHFLTYDLPYLQWLAGTGKQADFISDRDLDAVKGATALRRAYGVIVFPGHHEYVTTHEYDAVTGYRNLGGHLMFLCANDFFWRVVLHGDTITRTEQWRELGRPEASLIGVQFIRNDRGAHQGPWRVVTTKRVPWLFAGTGMATGSRFAMGGIEIDHVAPSSPAGTTIVARIPNLMGPGYTADMTYYRMPSGAEVFAAGAFTLAGARDPVSLRVLQNLWSHLGEPG